MIEIVNSDLPKNFTDAATLQNKMRLRTQPACIGH